MSEKMKVIIRMNSAEINMGDFTASVWRDGIMFEQDHISPEEIHEYKIFVNYVLDNYQNILDAQVNV